MTHEAQTAGPKAVLWIIAAILIEICIALWWVG